MRDGQGKNTYLVIIKKIWIGKRKRPGAGKSTAERRSEQGGGSADGRWAAGGREWMKELQANRLYTDSEWLRDGLGAYIKGHDLKALCFSRVWCVRQGSSSHKKHQPHLLVTPAGWTTWRCGSTQLSDFNLNTLRLEGNFSLSFADRCSFCRILVNLSGKKKVNSWHSLMHSGFALTWTTIFGLEKIIVAFSAALGPTFRVTAGSNNGLHSGFHRRLQWSDDQQAR